MLRLHMGKIQPGFANWIQDTTLSTIMHSSVVTQWLNLGTFKNLIELSHFVKNEITIKAHSLTAIQNTNQFGANSLRRKCTFYRDCMYW